MLEPFVGGLFAFNDVPAGSAIVLISHSRFDLARGAFWRGEQRYDGHECWKFQGEYDEEHFPWREVLDTDEPLESWQVYALAEHFGLGIVLVFHPKEKWDLDDIHAQSKSARRYARAVK